MGPAHSDALGAIGWWLDLTDEQKSQLRKIQEQGKSDAEAVQTAVADARDALHDAVIGGTAEAQIRAAATALGEAIGNQAILHAKTVAAAKAVLTDEQRKEFDKIRAKLPALRQRLTQGPGPFCPWADPDGAGQTMQPPMHGPGFGGGPLPVEEMFKAADTNKDGSLTMEELQAFRDGRRGARPSVDQ
jgi:Spy/CpxP family protein refolding chaperone